MKTLKEIINEALLGGKKLKHTTSKGYKTFEELKRGDTIYHVSKFNEGVIDEYWVDTVSGWLTTRYTDIPHRDNLNHKEEREYNRYDCDIKYRGSGWYSEAKVYRFAFLDYTKALLTTEKEIAQKFIDCDFNYEKLINSL